VKNFLDISSLREAKIVRLAVDSIHMHGMPREKFRIMQMVKIQFIILLLVSTNSRQVNTMFRT